MAFAEVQMFSSGMSRPEFARRADKSRFVNTELLVRTRKGVSVARSAARNSFAPGSARFSLTRTPSMSESHALTGGISLSAVSSFISGFMPLFYVPARVGPVNEFENGCDIAAAGRGSGNTEAYEAGLVRARRWGSVRGRVGRPPGRSASTMIVSCWLTGIGATSRTATGIWTMEAIRADVAARSLPFEVAVENLDHDFNIGSIVRTANAMGARRVHVVGRKRWNRRGAMVTDRYLPVDHCAEVRELVDHCSREGLSLVGVDNGPRGPSPSKGHSCPSAPAWSSGPRPRASARRCWSPARSSSPSLNAVPRAP